MADIDQDLQQLVGDPAFYSGEVANVADLYCYIDPMGSVRLALTEQQYFVSNCAGNWVYLCEARDYQAAEDSVQFLADFLGASGWAVSKGVVRRASIDELLISGVTFLESVATRADLDECTDPDGSVRMVTEMATCYVRAGSSWVPFSQPVSIGSGPVDGAGYSIGSGVLVQEPEPEPPAPLAPSADPAVAPGKRKIIIGE